MTSPKGHSRFIKQHNEHYNHHHSLMLAPSQEKNNRIYRPNKNTTTLSASCRDLPSQHISPFSYYSWQLTLSLNFALLPCCLIPSFPSTFIFNSLSSSSIVPHTHTVQVSHCLIWHWWCDLVARGYYALLWLELSCWWNTKPYWQSNKALTVLLTSVLLTAWRLYCEDSVVSVAG